MTETPLVTAILPSFNAASFIHATLASLDDQTHPSIEILVGDDASSDETPAILRDWAASRPHVRLILRETNLGWIDNCNDLMAKARGEFLFFAYHDDEMGPDFVASLVQALQDGTDAVLAYGHLERVETDGRTVMLTGRGVGRGASPFNRAAGMLAGLEWHVPNYGLFRASAATRVGGLKRNEAGEFAADFQWLLHMILLGRFVVVPRKLCTKRIHGENLSRSWDQDEAANNARDRAAIREIHASRLPFWQKWCLSLLVRSYGRGRR